MFKLIQRIGQALLLRVERFFNSVFGPELNPLYQLGAITFFLFWIVVVSGFYIYAFYRTGVNEAYASVERITEQWYLGGIMRSLHRYAADGMVITVFLHLSRNFVMNRFTGFRAFSWITGIVLLWLLYISGLNGYFLVWDKLAQFIAVASTEWLDFLPIFSSPLVRNFQYAGSVNDRFFSLLSFAHVGIPLIMLAFIWVHTQRVSGSKTHPSRPLALGFGGALIVLALVKPALSQGGHADLGVVPAQINLDWFFLGLYPLIYAWKPGQLWVLVGGLTLTMLLLPWLARTRRAKEGFHISTAPSARTFDAKPGETILEAGIRQGVRLPYLCRDGACGTCKGTLLHGSVDYGVYQKSALSDEEKQAGKALFCCAVPLSDVEIEYYETAEQHSVPVRIVQARVHKMTQVAPDVMLVDLKLPDNENLKFFAGQYIGILLDDGARRSFSFANAPHDDKYVQLHIRRIPGGKFTTHVFTQMKEGDELRFEGPLGTFHLREDSDKPLIFVAGATGFAPVKSMLEHAFHSGSRRRMLLYWGVRTRKDLYMADLAEKWQREHSNFTFVPVLSEPAAEDAWQGRTGLVHQAILHDFPDLGSYQLYACGSVKMVEAALPAFFGQGLPKESCFSDAFSLSSHKAAGAVAPEPEVSPS